MNFDKLLKQGEVRLKAKLEAEFLMIPKVFVKLNSKTNTIYSYIRFSKQHYWGASIILIKDCTLEMLNSMINETIDAYKHAIYEYLTKEVKTNVDM